MFDFLFIMFFIVIGLLGAYEYGKSDGNAYRRDKRK